MSRNSRRALFAAVLFSTCSSIAQAQQSIVEAAGLDPATAPLVAEVEGAAEVEYVAEVDAVAETGDAAEAQAQAPAPAVPPPVLDSPAPLATAALPCGCQHHCGCSKQKKAAAMAAMRGAYKGVFYANDFSYLNDPCYNGPSFCGDSLKGLCDGKLDLGGEFRVRYHDEDGIRSAGLTGVDDNFWLTRYRLFANYRFNDMFRFYGEYLYADSAGERINNRPIEENRGEAQNLFLDIKLLDGEHGKLIGRFGRQELLFGDQRLISPLDWANTRRTFDGYRGTWTKGKYTLDGFYVNPLNRDAAHEDRWDSTNDDVHFYGAYLSNKDHWLGTVDRYYLGLTNEALDFDYHTIGSRVVGSGWHDIKYVYEGGFQFGSNSPGFGDHDATYATGGLGKQLSIAGHKPTLWFWYDYASGGNDFPGARGDDGFDHLFPLAHKYLGLMDLFGRRNIHDINVQYIMPLHDKVSLMLWYHYFMLDEKTTPYSVTMAPYNNVAAAEDRELGHEIDVLFNITLNARNNVLVGYSHFNAGDYYDLTPGVQSNADADFFYFQYQARF